MTTCKLEVMALYSVHIYGIIHLRCGEYSLLNFVRKVIVGKCNLLKFCLSLLNVVALIPYMPLVGKLGKNNP